MIEDNIKQLKKKVADELETICNRMASYNKVDATLTEKTLIETLSYLRLADNALEKGFVKDACDEIDQQLNYYYN